MTCRMTFATTLVSFQSIRQSPNLQSRWDQLFEKSTSGSPLSSWRQVDLWQQTFAPQRSAQVVVVQQNQRWLAALPLVPHSFKRCLPIWDFPHDEWSGSLELLVANDVDRQPQLYDALVRQLGRLRRPLLRIPLCRVDHPIWAALLAAFQRSGRRLAVAPRHDIGLVDMAGTHAPSDWQAYEASWSGNFRRQMRKMEKRAEQLGGVELIVHQPDSSSGVAALVERGFTIEDRSWKGRAGTSVLRYPGRLDYFSRQAEALADRRHLILLFLEHRGQAIAFEYGWSFRGTYFSPKVGFDESYSHMSPGQLIRLLWIRRLFGEGTHQRFDFTGPLSEATEKWCTSRYSQVRLVVGVTAWGNEMLRAALWARTTASRLAATRRPAAPASVAAPASAASREKSERRGKKEEAGAN